MSYQRISPIAPPGSLLKGVAAPRAKKTKPQAPGKQPREKDDVHLEAIRQCPCVGCGTDPCGEAAHVRITLAKHGKRETGKGEKPADKWAVPLCHKEHMEQHAEGEGPFWQRLGIDPLVLCEQLYRVRANTEAMRAVVFVTRAMGQKEATK